MLWKQAENNLQTCHKLSRTVSQQVLMLVDKLKY
jgi:hypothetical protein